MFEVITAGMGEVFEAPDEKTAPELLQKWSEVYLKELEKNMAEDKWRKEKEKNYYDPSNNLEPEMPYDITPDTWPLPNSSDIRITIIRTDKTEM
jgi:hypothetical protein